ncbi:unnamed protein product, partial [Discosporangium mesarthrocarpum]
QEWIHVETKEIAEMNFRFANKSSPMGYVSHLASTMQLYPPELSVAGPSLVYDYDPGLISETLELLAPERMVMMVLGRGFEGKTDKVEPFYQTDYSANPIPESLLKAWRNPGRDPALRLPAPNPMIATDFKLHPPPPPEAPIGPILLRSDEFCRIWHRGDAEFRKPKLNMRVRLTTPELYKSP